MNNRLGPKEWAEANANLIAAAPELLEALRALVDHCELNNTTIKGPYFPILVNGARKAIAKAEGRAKHV